MIIIPEIETVVILVPRTGSRSLRLALLDAYPKAMQLYRHMEADGVPQGYDRWRKVGVVREPLERLWSLYKYIQTIRPAHDGAGKWEPAYVAAQLRSVSRSFDEWLLWNETVFTGPYDSADRGRIWPAFMVRHSLPENRKSQFVYLRPDLGTEVWRFEDLDLLARNLGVELERHHQTDPKPCPRLSAEAADHVARCFVWDRQASAQRSAA